MARGFLWVLTVIASIGLLAASFGGNIPPSELKGICLMVLSFPLWLILIAVATLLDLLWCRKALTMCVLVLISCASAIFNFCPLNIVAPSAKKFADKPHFSLLTYNVAGFNDLTGEYPGDVNPTVAYILHVDADIVALQESHNIGKAPAVHLTDRQVDSLHAAYPYIITSGNSLTLLSKFPAEAIHIPDDPTAEPSARNDASKIAAFRINVAGTPVTLFNVHLESYGLSNDDKLLYHKVTDLDDPDQSLRSMLRDVRTELLAKVQIAAVRRQRETERLVKLIDHFGGPNVIVTGDFNDVPGCYALRRLADCKMREVYPALAFGPTISFHADRFYFRIDHILWRGDMKPLRIRRGNLLASDHYPFTAYFAIDRNN